MCDKYPFYEGLLSEVCIFIVVFQGHQKVVLIQENLVC